MKIVNLAPLNGQYCQLISGQCVTFAHDLQNAGEELIGARAYRVIFALVSLPLAALALVYFINHRYSGTPLWNLRSVPGIHDAVWILNFISFYFLYPSTFNILEVSPTIKFPALSLIMCSSKVSNW